MSTEERSGHERLSGAWNFRDVAETAGVRPGRLFRSSELSRLDHAGRVVLTELGVTDVADLRSPVEVDRRGPGAVPTGVMLHHLPFPEVTTDDSGAAPHETSWQKMLTEHADEDPAEVAAKWMTAEYARFPALAGAKRAVRRIVTLIGEGRPVLVHCFAGKDRTGFAVAIACEAAGVDRDAIMADYLQSNTAASPLRERILQSTRAREGVTAEMTSFAESRLTEEVLGVREDYLLTARDALEKTYGGLSGYLHAAGVGDDDVARLRARLLG